MIKTLCVFARLDGEIVKIEDQVRTAIRKQLTAHEEVQHSFDEAIEQLSDQLKVMRESRSRLHGEALATQHKTAVQQATRALNQTLHRLLGKRRLVLPDGTIHGAVPVKRRQVRPA